MKPNQFFLYFDPLDMLSEAMRRRWADPREQDVMVDVALRKARRHAR